MALVSRGSLSFPICQRLSVLAQLQPTCDCEVGPQVGHIQPQDLRLLLQTLSAPVFARSPTRGSSSSLGLFPCPEMAVGMERRP